eukprot:TRINITY_DN17526_c0_g3_i1.p1 TRINITY_DN17526_c0_g3~~TRINITY_DN17526_c0_g3_i1.p1  ORF type:complete len:788 (-),score=73.18 TRINITY_DN17526_c0_g3_i1:80-2443(-)
MACRVPLRLLLVPIACALAQALKPESADALLPDDASKASPTQPGDPRLQDLQDSQDFPQQGGSPSTASHTGNDVANMFLGNAKWPLAGQAQRPPPGSANDASGLILLTAGFALLSSLTAFVFLAFYITSFASSQTSSGIPGTFTHMKALVSAFTWRSCHPRALLSHALRLLFPFVFIYSIYKAKKFIIDNTQSLETLSLLSHVNVEASLVDFAYVLASFSVVVSAMSSFAHHLTMESESGLRHLLHISGVSHFPYIFVTTVTEGLAWTAFSVFVVSFASLCLNVRIVVWSSLLLLILTSLVVGVAASLVAYMIAMVFRSSSTSNVVSRILQVVLLFVAPFLPLGPHIPDSWQQSWLFIALPVVPAYRAFAELASACAHNRCLEFDDVSNALSEGHWANPMALLFGRENGSKHDLNPADAYVSFMLVLCVQSFLGWALVVILDYHMNPPLCIKSGEAISGHTLLKVDSLKHSYGWSFGRKKPILNGVSFSIDAGDMLGLLGPNGAGKTTTIRCITGEEQPTTGGVSFNMSAQKGAMLGLCPQETVVVQSLTVEENLMFYCVIRGVTSEKEVASCVDQILGATRLEEKRKWFPDTLSGGMRRRLAVGCSMVAAPSVVVLDEPSTGLDPVSRRGIWTTIRSIRSTGSCCLLTTHMLEEAEELCSNIVILKKGEIAAEGSVQDLKEQWGTGYTVSIDSVENKMELVENFMSTLLPEVDKQPVRKNEHGQFTYRVKCEDEGLGHLILAIARGKVDAGIKRWGVSQASLEDAYLRVIEVAPTGDDSPTGDTQV